MQPNALLQILIIIFAIMIVVVYVRPTFQTIGSIQDETFEFRDAVAKASEFNARLSELLAVENSFADADLAALDTYLPSRLDSVTIFSHIAVIAESAGVSIESLRVGDAYQPNTEAVFAASDIALQEQLSHQDFDFGGSGDYESVKTFLRKLESNAYPLEIIELDLKPVQSEQEGGESRNLLSFAMVIRTYALVE